jgi:hypothetical protein
MLARTPMADLLMTQRLSTPQKIHGCRRRRANRHLASRACSFQIAR